MPDRRARGRRRRRGRRSAPAGRSPSTCWSATWTRCAAATSRRSSARAARCSATPRTRTPPISTSRSTAAIAAGASSESVIVGGDGGRLDHLLGNALIMRRPAIRRDRARRGLRARAGCTSSEARGSCRARPASSISLFALGGPARGVRHRGSALAARRTRSWNRVRAWASATSSSASARSIEVRTGVVLAIRAGGGRLMRRPARLVVAVVVVSLIVAACTGDAAPAAPGSERPVTVTLLTHDSFDVSREGRAGVRARRAASTLQIVPAGDAGTAREPGDPDRRATPRATCCSASTTTCSRRRSRRACSSPYGSPALDARRRRVRARPDARRDADRSRRRLPERRPRRGSRSAASRRPTSIEDLTDPAYRGLTVVENPATSTPGLAFLLATVARFGEPGLGGLLARPARERRARRRRLGAGLLRRVLGRGRGRG